MSSATAAEPMSGGKKAAIVGLAVVALVMAFILLVLTMAANLFPAGSQREQMLPAGKACTQVAGIPKPTCDAYLQAAENIKEIRPKCKGLKWSLLAGIGKIESNHGQFGGSHVQANGDVEPWIIGPRLDGSHGTQAVPDTDGGKYDRDTQYDRAVGPTQFIPSTWDHVAQDGDKDGDKDPQNVFDSALTTAAYLCGEGDTDLSDGKQEHDAIYRYNHSEEYIRNVLAAKANYDALGDVEGPINASERGKKIIEAAKKQEGLPYSWGGGGPNGPSYGTCCSQSGQDGGTVYGFDCSGLSEYAYAQVGAMIGGDAQAQHDSNKLKVTTQPRSLAGAEPGDLLFFSVNPGSGKIHHVSIYLGHNQQVEAPQPGEDVTESPVRIKGLDSIGQLP